MNLPITHMRPATSDMGEHRGIVQILKADKLRFLV
jgi:hypothetical protein